MIYEFYITGEAIELVRQFVGFAETLSSTRHVYLEYRNAHNEKSSIVRVLCSHDDYLELFYWLKDKGIKARILTTASKERGNKK